MTKQKRESLNQTKKSLEDRTHQLNEDLKALNQSKQWIKESEAKLKQIHEEIDLSTRHTNKVLVQSMYNQLDAGKCG